MLVAVRGAMEKVVAVSTGHALRNIRESRQVSVAQFAAQTGLSPDNVKKYERGTTPMTVTRLVEITAPIHVSPARLTDTVMQQLRPPLRIPQAVSTPGAVFRPGDRADTSWLHTTDRTVISQIIPKAIGTQLRTTRLAHKLSQAQLVALLPSGITISLLSMYENGNCGLWLARFIEICWVMGRPPGDVLHAALSAAQDSVTNPTNRSALAPKPPKEKRARSRVYKPEEAREVAAKYKNEMSIRALAIEYERPYGTIRNMILSTGTPLRRQGKNPKNKKRPTLPDTTNATDLTD